MKIHQKIISVYRQAYSDLPATAWLLSPVEFVNRSGTMVLFFMTLYLTQKMGFSPARAGQVISAYGLGALLGAYLGGKLSDAIGSIRVLKIRPLSPAYSICDWKNFNRLLASFSPCFFWEF